MECCYFLTKHILLQNSNIRFKSKKIKNLYAIFFLMLFTDLRLLTTDSLILWLKLAFEVKISRFKIKKITYLCEG